MTDVWISTSNKARVLHVDPECPRLSTSSIRGPIDRSTHPNTALCEWCDGDAPTKGNDRSSQTHYEALKAAAKARE